MKIKENIKKIIRSFGYPVRYYHRKKRKKLDSERIGIDLLDFHFSPPKTQLEMKKYLKILSKLNASWARISFDWYSFRKNKKNYFPLMDKFITKLKTQNLNILGVICNIVPGNIINWLGPNKNSYLAPIDHMKDFLNFTKKAVSYYCEEIRYWEFMNEPDTKRHWIYTANAKDYIKMLKNAYLTIKTINQDLKVVSGGLAETWLNLDPKNNFNTSFLKKLTTYNLAKYCDIIGIHVWPISSYFGLSIDPFFYTKEIIRKTKIMVNFIKEAKIKHDIWITETGINSMWSLIDENDIAASYNLLMRKLNRINQIQKIFFFNFRDFPNPYYEFFNPDPYFGLVTKDYKIKESARFLIKRK